MSFDVSESLAAGETAADVVPQNLEAGASTTTKRRTASITHGSGISLVVDDELDVYDHLRELWRERVGEPGERAVVDADIDFLPDGEYKWVFHSSGWRAGAENAHGNWKQWYEYHIRLRREEVVNGERTLKKPSTSCSIDVTPQDDQLTYEDGNDYTLPFGEGSRFHIKTTYAERSGEVVDRLFTSLADAIASLGGDPGLVDVGDMKPESARITKLETYLRVDQDEKHAVKRCLDKSENLIDVGGGSEIETWKQRDREGWLEARVTSDRWSRLGLDPLEVDAIEDGEETEKRLERELKIYQMTDWAERDRDDPLAHPKLEASLGGGSAHLSEWDDVLASLRQLALAHLEWAGVDDGDLVADHYFKPSVQPTTEFEHPEGRREDLRRYYSRFEAVVWSEALKHETTAVYDLLSYLGENYGATYDQLEAELGYSRSNIEYHVGRLKEAGLLVTIGNPAIIAFDADHLYDQVLELIESKIAPHFDEETLAARRLGREERAQERREARESGEANGTASPSDQEESDDDQEESDDEDAESEPFVYLEEFDGSLLDIEHQLESPDHPRDERDVRVRRFEPPE